MSKSIVLGIVFLVIGLIFSSSSYCLSINSAQILSFENNILYVGGNGEGNYSYIQDAIENASDGDSVYVFDESSPYLGSIAIDKSIDLIGENKNTTIIDSRQNSNTIKIRKNWININGFTINNGRIRNCDGFSNIVISNNHFINDDKNNEAGITLFYVENININSNTFTDCNTSIKINECIKNVIINNNTFIYNSKNNFSECEIDCFEGEYITISNNTFKNYYQNGKRTCIQIDFSDNYIINANEINGYYYGIRNNIEHSTFNDNNLISNNNFINNSESISISGSYNRIMNNNFIDNSFGCRLYHGRYNVILDNNFINNMIDASSTILPQGNIWDGNYWDKWIGLKYPVLSFLPYIYFSILGSFIDWHPAKESHNITTTQGCDIE